MKKQNTRNLRSYRNPVASKPVTKTKVMLVDDHRLFRESLKQALTNRGFEIVGEAKTGQEAIERAASLRPEVVLMDINMSGMDGVEASRKITERSPNTHIIILTMYSDQSTLSEAMSAGVKGYLVKDCSIDEISAAIESVVIGETALSPHLAASVLTEVSSYKNVSKSDRVITKREEEVLQLIANGASTPEVADQLFISQKTVKNHLASIYQKLDARDRTQAVLQAVRMGIVTLN